MKLALVRQRYTPYGGAERFVERALKALSSQDAQANLEVSLITRQWQGENHLQTHDQTHDQIYTCNPFYLGRLWRDWGFSRCVQKIISRNLFDLVQSHERIPGCHIYRAGDGVHATWLALRGRAASAFSRMATHFHPWHRYTLAAEERLFADKNLRAVICNSTMVKNDIAQRFNVPDSKLHVIYNGVDLAAFHPTVARDYRVAMRKAYDIDEDAPVFLYVGSGFARKGVPQLLRAFSVMNNPQAKLIIVGHDKRMKKMIKLAVALGVKDSVQFLGGQKDLRPYYGMADVFVLPTLYDPFPNAALEALACGLPTLTSTTCGVAELIRQGENGMVCDALDIGALARYMRQLGQPGVANSMRLASRASVEHLGLNIMVEKLGGVYKQYLSTPAIPVLSASNPNRPREAHFF